MTARRRLTVALLLGLSANGCSNSPPPPHFPPLSFANEPVFAFDVARIDVVNQYKAPGSRPHIESDMPVSPEAAVRRWAQDRLKAVGQRGTLRVLIRDASATENPLPTDQSFAGNFKKEEVARVDMSLDVAVQVLDDRQFVQGEVSQRNQISQTELDGITLNDRDKLLYTMVDEMSKSFDRAIDPTIHNTLANQLVIR